MLLNARSARQSPALGRTSLLRQQNAESRAGVIAAREQVAGRRGRTGGKHPGCHVLWVETAHLRHSYPTHTSLLHFVVGPPYLC